MKVAVLGMGIIGSAWSKNLAADGHEVRCWNRTWREGSGWCRTVAEAAEGAEAVFIVVADPAAVSEVLDQLVPVLQGGTLVLQCSTISAEWTKTFAARVTATGALFLEAPFTGSKPAAEQRQTVYYLGGDEEVVAAARPLLEPISSAIFHIGPTGSASTLKLAMNLNIAGVAQSLCESLTLARSAGISDDTYFAVLARNVSHSGVADLKEPKLRQHDYAPQFSLKHMAKDLRLALETAAACGVPLEQTGRLRDIYERGLASGWGEEDFIGLVRLVEGKE
ncbi:MAG TPA: NAD(P)-dependent oxidoreductase [Verrucomicrobiae bacterium]|nr:NAD(P)-dependent oxidoreductase [Verrucomicrobiae bacterium]